MIVTIGTYIGVCCREWVLAVGGRGKCGLCGTVPVFVRESEPIYYAT